MNSKFQAQQTGLQTGTDSKITTEWGGVAPDPPLLLDGAGRGGFGAVGIFAIPNHIKKGSPLLWVHFIFVVVVVFLDLCALDDLATELVKFRENISKLVAKIESRVVVDEGEFVDDGPKDRGMWAKLHFLWRRLKDLWSEGTVPVPLAEKCLPFVEDLFVVSHLQKTQWSEDPFAVLERPNFVLAGLAAVVTG
ncbi:Uncharacterized protein Adt_01569 [Abeliophyllum distichum]|uniref:Uncharacterized protein n=1 Tax=Abeliophyllum distichum TaxID=126358 RepID=A0ABD1VTN4_9LAMI